MEMVLFLQCDALQFFWCYHEEKKREAAAVARGEKRAAARC